jgi:hypothetical protein
MQIIKIIIIIIIIVRFEVFTAVTMKNVVFWDRAPCRSCVWRSLGGTRLRWFLTRGFFYLKMEVIRFSETSVHTISTRRRIPEYGILHIIIIIDHHHNPCTCAQVSKLVSRVLKESTGCPSQTSQTLPAYIFLVDKIRQRLLRLANITCLMSKSRAHIG